MNFLLIKLNHIGDTLLLTPTLRMLRERYPEARLDVVVRRGPHVVLEGNPDLSRLFCAPAPAKERGSALSSLLDLARTGAGLLGKRYDYAFDLSNSDRARFLMWLTGSRVRSANNAYGELGAKRRFYNQLSSYAWGEHHQVLKDFKTVTEALGIDAEPGPLFVASTEPSAQLRERLPCVRTSSPYAVIHPTSRWAFKQWLPERWAAVADWLHTNRRLDVVFSSGPDAREQAQVRQMIARSKTAHACTEGQASLRELAGLLRGARLFCGVDTVAMHLAAAAQTPTVALFGPSSEWSWHPWQTRHELVLGPCTCKQKRAFTCDKSKPYPCMEAISVASVIEKIQRLLPDA